MKKVTVLVSSLDSNGDYLKVGTHPEVDEKTYEKLIGLKNIRDYNEDIDGEQTDDDSELQGEFDTLKGEKDTLQGEFDTLKGEKDTLAQESGDEIVKLKAQLVEAIGLPKGQKPAGYEE